jgi:hypothetical protein
VTTSRTADGSSVSFAQLRASVRALKREGLLRQLGAFSASEWGRTNGDAAAQTAVYPWHVSLLAREALLSPSNANRQGNSTPMPQTLLELGRMVQSLDEPLLHSEGYRDDIFDFEVRSAYLQFPYGTNNLLNPLARLAPMLSRTFPSSRYKILCAQSLKEVLGASFEVFLHSAMFFGAAAWKNGGRFDPAWLAGPQFEPIRAVIGTDELLAVFRRSWSASFATLRREAKTSTSTDPLVRQFDWNPLRGRPFVELSDGAFIAPQTWYAQSHVTPSTIYHLGLRRFGEQWSIDLGLAQEDYILDQLRQLAPTSDVYGEIEYGPRRARVKTVDAILVTPKAVVLVESKSLRASLDSMTSFERYQERLSRDLVKALGTQIRRTATHVRDGLSPLDHLPNDRPIVALVVTPEPLYLANIDAARARLPDASVPYAVVSLTELEHLVGCTLRDPSGAAFLDATSPNAKGQVDVGQTLMRLIGPTTPVNPLIEEGFAKIGWEPDESEDPL